MTGLCSDTAGGTGPRRAPLAGWRLSPVHPRSVAGPGPAAAQVSRDGAGGRRRAGASAGAVPFGGARPALPAARRAGQCLWLRPRSSLTQGLLVKTCVRPPALPGRSVSLGPGAAARAERSGRARPAVRQNEPGDDPCGEGVIVCQRNIII